VTAVLWTLRLVVTGLIFALAGLSFLPRAGAEALVPLQKYLTDRIARRGG